jgi:ABC-type Fe3+/spermidine/putrescine transport system ATPase subunit
VAVLELEKLTKKYNGAAAVDGLDLSVKDGEMTALLGESGCGKTTTLRMVAGFIRPDSGAVLIDGKNVSGIPAYKRNVGVFFQNYALFPHLSVYDNVAFGLKLQKLSRGEIKSKAAQMLELVKLTGLEERFPRELSGGQQQRVALAMALVTRPKLLLLDEPLSNLDAKLREEMQTELRRIQRELGITAIIVTPDQEEAISMADRVAVMRRGRIVQIGTPEEIYENPAGAFVADFMGFSNFFDGIVGDKEGDYIQVRCGTWVLKVLPGRCPFAPGTAVKLAIRPENIAIGGASLPGKIESLTYRGSVTRIEVSGLLGKTIFVHTKEYSGERSGDLGLAFPPEKLLVFPLIDND